jgi:hypothetical protein
MLSGPLHNRGADGNCSDCGEYYPCRTATHLLVVQRDEQEADRLYANVVDQFETADVPPRPGEVGARGGPNPNGLQYTRTIHPEGLSREQPRCRLAPVARVARVARSA